MFVDLALLACGGLVLAAGTHQVHVGWGHLKFAIANPERTGWTLVAETCFIVGLIRIVMALVIAGNFQDGYGATSSLLIPMFTVASLLELRKNLRLREMGVPKPNLGITIYPCGRPVVREQPCPIQHRHGEPNPQVTQ